MNKIGCLGISLSPIACLFSGLSFTTEQIVYTVLISGLFFALWRAMFVRSNNNYQYPKREQVTRKGTLTEAASVFAWHGGYLYKPIEVDLRDKHGDANENSGDPYNHTFNGINDALYLLSKQEAYQRRGVFLNFIAEDVDLLKKKYHEDLNRVFESQFTKG